MPVLSDDIQLTAPAPGPVLGVSAQIVGASGLQTFYYWFVANYPIGASAISAPLLVRSAPDILSATNYVIVTGQPVIGATSYDLLRTSSPLLPSTTANIAVVTGLGTPTYSDQGAALSAYSLAGLPAGAPVTATIGLNNRDYAQPTMVVSPYTLAVNALVFPNGSTQTIAGITPAQQYSWVQNVQANGNQLLGLGKLEVLGGTFGFNFTTTATTAAFNAGTLLIQNETTSLFPLIITPNGDVWIGPQTVASSRGGRLNVTTQSGYPGTANNAMFYCYNALASCVMWLETSAAAQSSSLIFKTPTGSGYQVNATAFAGTFVIQDNNGGSSQYRIIIGTTGKVGIANGTNFTPAHQLELNVDDAAKPTSTTWTTTSDIRTKRNVRPLEGGINIIELLEPIEAEYNGNAQTPDGSRVVSFDPEKLRRILPGAVSSVRAKLRPEDEDETDIQGITTHEVIFHLVLAVQQLAQQVKSTDAGQRVSSRHRGKQ